MEIGFKEVDADGNGGVELHEFNSFLYALEIYDLNNDRTVSREEARKSNDPKIFSETVVLLQPYDIIKGTQRARLLELIESLKNKDDGEED